MVRNILIAVGAAAVIAGVVGLTVSTAIYVVLIVVGVLCLALAVAVEMRERVRRKRAVPTAVAPASTDTGVLNRPGGTAYLPGAKIRGFVVGIDNEGLLDAPDVDVVGPDKGDQRDEGDVP